MDKPERPRLTPLQRRAIDAAGAEEAEDLLFQHTVFCQTCLPYRDPGDDVREWARINGAVHLKVLAGEAMHPETERFVPVGLPFGPKPRLVLAHLNAEALRTGSPVIQVEGSLRAFVLRLKLDTGGRTVSTIKDQLARLSASSIRLGLVQGGRALTVNSQIITAFDLWFPKDDRQRVLWPTTVQLSADYFQSLTKHAVPLDEGAIRVLAHSAMALDVYAWLAQRLHRIDPGKPAFIPWAALKTQFGWDYARIRKFREVFERTLRLVHTQYRGARFEMDERGMTLWHSSPPVKGRIGIVSNIGKLGTD
jgi:Plasmid encoded RepA protein